MPLSVPEGPKMAPRLAHAVGTKGIERRLDRTGRPRYRATAYVRGRKRAGPWSADLALAKQQRAEMLAGQFPQPRREKSSDPGQHGVRMVYFIQAVTGGPVKIGYTRGSLGARLSQLQSGNPEELRVIGVRRGGRDLERELHQRLRHCHVRGEWFALSELLLATITSDASTRRELESIDIEAARRRLREVPGVVLP
jgi:hypothetical protein